MVVFNEVMYHPATNELQSEWVELHNQMAVDVDISGWSLQNGVQFTFPEGTVIAGGGYLVVASSPDSLKTATGITNVLGPFAGRLSNSGETLELRNNNQRLMDALTYGVEEEWPVAPDGAGPSLAKLDEELAGSQPSDWRTSQQSGGTPGAANFPPRVLTVATTAVLNFDSAWRYDASGIDRGVAWRAAAYDDSAWTVGTGLFHANAIPPGELRAIPTLFSSGVAADGLALAAGALDPHYVLTLSAYSTPPPPDIPATVMANHSAWIANDATSMWVGAVSQGTTSVPAGRYAFRTTFNLTGFNPATAQVALQAAVDNQLTNVALNGATTLLRYSNFNAFSSVLTLTNGFLAATNTLDFTTVNATTSASPGGLRVKATGTAVRMTPTNTGLSLGPTTYYFRKSFVVNGNPAATACQIRSIVDDGAVFYLNGAELFRQNMPAGQPSYATAAVSNIANAAFYGPVTLPSPSLVAGTNVLAVEVHQAAGGFTDVLFGAELVVFSTNSPAPVLPKLAFNELPSVTNGSFWVEILNYGDAMESLGGLVLARVRSSTNAEYVLPAQSLPPGGRLVLDKAATGFGADPGDQVILFAPNKTAVIDAVIAKRYARARWPEGTGAWLSPSALTPGATNSVAFHDEIVINEILYHARDLTNGTPSPESWVELFNRSTNAMDLTGWRLDGDIGYVFSTGTVMAAGSYLVVAGDGVYFHQLYPGIGVLGNFSGQLSKSGSTVILRDAADNPANRVQYFDDTPWPALADDGGSSLELRDPWADNARPEAWAASDESGHSFWQTYTYRGTNANETASSPTKWREFVFGLLGAGEVLLDDFSVIESPGTANRQLLQNGSFENGASAWRFLGNHRLAEVIGDPGNPANHVLHLGATSDTEHMHNHIETTLTNNLPVTNGLSYEISFRAKWLAGCNRLNTRLYFNRLARSTNLAVPVLGGTPGAQNSRFAANLGPVFGSLQHTPIVPLATNSVTASVTAFDANTVASARLLYQVNGGLWQALALGFTPAKTVQLQGIIPPQAASNVVQFYFEATDSLGATATYPPGGTNSRALYAVGGQTLLPKLHTVRILMTPADVARMHAPTNVMSNERLGCTIVADEQRTFYGAGIHLQGSERARNTPLRRGFSLELPRDRLYRGVQAHLTVDPSGGYSGKGGKQDEMLLKHAVNKVGGLPGMYDDLVQFFAPLPAEDGTGILLMARYDDGFLDSQFDHGSDGEMYKLELIYYPTNTVNGDPQAWKLPQPDLVLGTDIKNLGDSPEAYRWTFLKENHVATDNYAPMVALAKAFSLTGTALDAQMQGLMDVEEWMRAVAFISLIGANDIYTYGGSHNLIIYFRPGDQRAMAFPWDMDYAFAASVNQAFPGTGSTTTYNLVSSIPNNLRHYYWHLMDLSELTGNTAYMGKWATHYSGMVGQNWSGAVTFLAQRAAYVRGFLPLNVPFAITNHGGADFTVTNSPLTLVGTAPLLVKDILVNGVVSPVTWLSLSNWSVVVPLPAATNLLTVQGLDKNGSAVSNAFDTITVKNGGLLAPVPVVINEWMAANGGPNGFPDPADGKFQDWIELFNPNYRPADLSGFYLTDNLSQPAKWQIPTNTIIAARGFLLVWADNEPEQNGLDSSGDLHAAFALSQGGEAIGLYSTNLTPQHTLTFGAQSPNISQGFCPDGDTNGLMFMPNWTPRQPNQAGAPPQPQLDSPVLLPGGTISFSVGALAGHTYRVEYKTDLALPVWTPLSTNRATSDFIPVSDVTTNRLQRFYRAVLLP